VSYELCEAIQGYNEYIYTIIMNFLNFELLKIKEMKFFSSVLHTTAQHKKITAKVNLINFVSGFGEKRHE
jgi:hypothetical protein